MIISSYSGVLEDDLVYISAIRSMKNLTDESKLSFHMHVKLSIYQNTTFIEYLCRKDSELYFQNVEIPNNPSILNPK